MDRNTKLGILLSLLSSQRKKALGASICLVVTCHVSKGYAHKGKECYKGERHFQGILEVGTGYLRIGMHDMHHRNMMCTR
jgi:hypothetical protein